MAEFFLLTSSEDEEKINERVIRRHLRNTSNPLSLPNKAFIKRFRLNKEAFKLVFSKLTFSGQLSTAIPEVLQLACTLSLLGSGCYQHLVGADYLIGMSQSTISTVVSNVLDTMENTLCPDYIKFDPLSSERCKEWFFRKYKIPGVIGCIDGSHIELQKPTQNEHMFFNRKGKHSLNAMIICDHQYKIKAINSKYGGAAHDSFVWKESEERKMLEQYFVNKQNKNCWLLGDSGYPIEPWCITPYRAPADGSDEAAFNQIHSKARSIVERAIGVLKGRWRILIYDKRGRYAPEKVCKFSNVCTALHNICIDYRIPFRFRNNQKLFPQDFHVESDSSYTKIGQKIRDQIKCSILR